jgi:soluble lytic murein transglycosylase-like protein
VKPTQSVEAATVQSLTGCERFRPIISQYDWDVRIAMAIMQAESTTNKHGVSVPCDPTADNTGLNTDGTNDKGLMQVNSIHVTSGLIGDEERFNPEANIKAAYAIYRGGGWQRWSSFNNGLYQKYL